MTREEILEKMSGFKEKFSFEAMKLTTVLSADIFHEVMSDCNTDEITNDMQECIMCFSTLISNYQEAMETCKKKLEESESEDGGEE